MLAKAKGGKAGKKKKKTNKSKDEDEETTQTETEADFSTFVYLSIEKKKMGTPTKIILAVIAVLAFIAGCIKAYKMMFWTAPTYTA